MSEITPACPKLPHLTVIILPNVRLAVLLVMVLIKGRLIKRRVSTADKMHMHMHNMVRFDFDWPGKNWPGLLRPLVEFSYACVLKKM